MSIHLVVRDFGTQDQAQDLERHNLERHMLDSVGVSRFLVDIIIHLVVCVCVLV